MNLEPAFPMKLSYCLVILGAVVPFGLAKSGWVALATGGGAIGMIPLVGPLLFLVLGLYRIYLVARVAGTLNSPAVSGAIAVLRTFGAFCIHVGAIVTVLSWVSGPLMRVFIKQRTESGAEFFVVGMYLALAAGIGVLGLFLFEFSRLLAFERHTQETRS